jgi:hypothetical protein
MFQFIRVGLVALVVVSFAAVQHASAVTYTQLFFDNFDSDTVGVLPSTFTYTFNPGAPYSGAVVADGTAPSTPNAYQVDNPNNQAFEVSRFFPIQHVQTVGGVRFGYSLNMTVLAADNSHGNIGPNFAFGVGSGGGYSEGFGGGSLRIIPSGGTHWLPYDPAQGFLTAALPLNTWHTIFVDFFPTTAVYLLQAPEPTGIAVFGLGAAGVLLRRNRRA